MKIFYCTALCHFKHIFRMRSSQQNLEFYQETKMAKSAALFLTSWKNNSYGPANWKLITDICENTLKKKSKLSEIYCTVLDVELSEEQREGAARHGVTLIPATRPKWSTPDEDPPAIIWLLHHDKYYPGLAKLEDITHVVGLYAKTHNAASAIHESLFQQAKLHLVPSEPAALFVGNSWSADELGLTGFHRTLVQDFCERKAKAGEDLKAYSTVLDVKISDDQKKDAESCGVTLIPAQRKEKADHRDDPPKLEWLLNHEIYYPDLQKLENVQYVVGYAPKTGRAAADIKRKLFPGAKLVYINHACPELNYLQAEEYSHSEFEEKMLQMASEADLLFSIGPVIYEYFQNAYRAEFQGRDLSDIPHEEILPKPNRCFWVKDPKLRPVTRHHILTYGQMDTQMAIEGCKSIAASIGTVANHRKAHYSSHPDWKIQGVSKKAGRTEQKILADASESPYVYPKLQPGYSAKSLLTSLQQSHLCMPSPCYWDYSFHGLEAMAFGLPTSVDEDSHLGHFVMKYLEMHIDYCVVRICEDKLSKKISQHLQDTPLAFTKAKDLKTALTKCEAITESFAKFASLLTESIKKESEDDADVKHSSYIGQSNIQSTKQVPESLNGTMSTLAVTKDDGTGSQGIEETHGDVMDKEDTESGQVKTTPSEKENEKPNTEEAKVRNCNEEHQDFQVKVALDDEILQKSLRQSEEQTQAISVQQQQNDHEVKAAWRECEQGLKRRVQAVLADEESCSEVKKICKEKVGLDPNTVTAKSLGILLKILTLYYLYRVKQTCRSRSLAKALEPLLITDEMRKIADTVGITLQLKAMYDMVKFEEIELFFINRDGGGVQPVTFHDETEDNGGHCNLGSEGEKSDLSQPASDPIAEPSQTNLEQSLEEKLTQHGDPTLSITAAYSSLSLQARSLLPIKPSKYQLTDSDIRYLALAKSKVQSLQRQLDKAFTEKLILQGRLTDALNEKSQFKLQCDEYMQQYQNAEKVVATQRSEINTQTAQCDEYMQKYQNAEKVIATQRSEINTQTAQRDEYMQKYQNAEKVVATQRSEINTQTAQRDAQYQNAEKVVATQLGEINTLTAQLKEKDKVITGLRIQLEQVSGAQSDIELLKKLAEERQLGETIVISEMDDTHNEYTKPKITEIEKEEASQPKMTSMEGSEMETATPTQPEMTVREGSEMETGTSTQPEMTAEEGSEMETVTSTQPEMTAEEGSEMETVTSTQPEMTVREGHGIKTEVVTTATEHQTGKRDSSGIFGKFFKRRTGRKDKTDGSKVMSIGKKELSGSVTASSKELSSSSGPVSSVMSGGIALSGSKELSSGPVSSVMSGGIALPGSKELSGGPVSSVMSGGTSTLPGSKEEQSGSYSDGIGKGSDLESMEEMVGGGAFSSTEALCGSDVDSDDETSDSESMEEMVGGRATPSSAGRWSRRTLKGHQGHKFKDVRGLAFHNDKLLVCDSDNNIVHILNQDYTCEKELGSFSDQFAKPFQPWSIAVSQDNLYFILDHSNEQIVVCDQNNKVIRIITLPTDSNPWCIALVSGFVIVTEVKGHHILKYSQTGQYISEFGSRGNRKTQFDGPSFVAVNSRDVIMVSDCNNHCIKCFDNDLNYLYKYAQIGTGDGQLYYPECIAVDGADHVYVCEFSNGRISMWSGDGTWRRHLFQREVSWPWYMAVTAYGDRIAVRGYPSNEIVVFSKSRQRHQDDV
ncbi:uro-adherence factor A-like isoform X2 [Ptychodera flava]|uniref:uro-adherence factor A-like isoform X2 n=2 Tax=Ptychodera flava TaxID=63121 RepID=UPI00396A40F4